jgi:hypothetical protein
MCVIGVVIQLFVCLPRSGISYFFLFLCFICDLYGVCSGDTDEVLRLIESKVDIDEGDYDSRTPMHLVITLFICIFTQLSAMLCAKKIFAKYKLSYTRCSNKFAFFRIMFFNLSSE